MYHKEMKKLACHDIGLDCGYIIEGKTEEDIVKSAEQYIGNTCYKTRRDHFGNES